MPQSLAQKNLLGKIFNPRTKSVFFENGGEKLLCLQLQLNVREPGVNPGRLRHCYGYNSQCHCPRAGRREEGLMPKSGYRFDCSRQPRAYRGTSPQREGWGQSAGLFLAEFAECLHSPFCGMEVFCFRRQRWTGALLPPWSLNHKSFAFIY